MPVDAAVLLSDSANVATILQTTFKIISKIAQYAASINAKEPDLVIASRNLDTALEFLTDLVTVDSDMDPSDASVLLGLALRHQELSIECQKMLEVFIKAPKSIWKRWIPFIAADRSAVADSQQWTRVREQTEKLQDRTKAFSDRRKRMGVIVFSRQKGAVVDNDNGSIRSAHSIVSAWTHVSHGDTDVYSVPQQSETTVSTETNASQPTASVTMTITTNPTLEHDVVLYHNLWD